jgi:hypothetical protein
MTHKRKQTIKLTDEFVNAPTKKEALKKLKFYYRNLYKVEKVKNWRKSKGDKYGDNYWFDLEVSKK